ncbi:MAG TPA: hypothetical protein VGE72_11930 [Azospirillum sp.]
MRGNLKILLLAAVATTVLTGGASAAERQLRVETVDLWSWRGRPAVQATATGGPAAAPDTPVRLAFPVAVTPDASARPAPEGDTSQMLSTPMVPVRPDAPDDLKSAWGCVIGGTVGTGVALAANAENLINLVAGGIVAPASPAVLAIGLAGVVFGTFCTLGQAVTPLYVHYFERANEAPAPAPSKEVAQSLVHGPAGRPADVAINLSAKR